MLFHFTVYCMIKRSISIPPQMPNSSNNQMDAIKVKIKQNLPVIVDVIEFHRPPSEESFESFPSRSSLRLSGFFETFNLTILL